MKSLLRFNFKAHLKLALISFALVVSSCGQRPGDAKIESLWEDRKASRSIEDKAMESARQSYFKILEKNPDLPQVHSNIGVLFFQDKKSDEALKSFQQALKLAKEQHNAKAEFAIQYNLGVYYGEQKKIPEALEAYQAALEIVPDSKETKTNIELLIQSQNQSKDGKGDQKDQKDSKDSKDNKDNQDKKEKGDKGQQDKKDQDKKDGKDKEDDKDKKDKDEKDKKDQEEKDKEKEKGEKDKPKDYSPSAKYKPRPFEGDQLSEGDVKKILGELKNQEQKIRANFDKKERKENKNEKDW